MPRQVKGNNRPYACQSGADKLPTGKTAAKPMHQQKRRTSLLCPRALHTGYSDTQGMRPNLNMADAITHVQ